jgi:hypothetical protein
MVYNVFTEVERDAGGNRIKTVERTDPDAEYAVVRCELPVEDPGRFICSAYHDTTDSDPDFRTVFRLRSLSFSPISIAGLGERESMTGVTNQNERRGYEDIPNGVRQSLNTLGFAAVPDGEWWIDE